MTLKPVERSTLEQLAREKGLTPSTVAALYVRKGLEAERPQTDPQELVDSGFCPDLAESDKLLRFLGNKR